MKRYVAIAFVFIALAAGVASAGHAQCCWTNGFVKVTVTP